MDDVYGISADLRGALPGPLATMVRTWVRAYQNEDLAVSLATHEASLPPAASRDLPTATPWSRGAAETR